MIFKCILIFLITSLYFSRNNYFFILLSSILFIKFDFFLFFFFSLSLSDFLYCRQCRNNCRMLKRNDPRKSKRSQIDDTQEYTKEEVAVASEIVQYDMAASKYTIGPHFVSVYPKSFGIDESFRRSARPLGKPQSPIRSGIPFYRWDWEFGIDRGRHAISTAKFEPGHRHHAIRHAQMAGTRNH